MNPLSGYHQRPALVDIDVDADLSAAVDILGYEVVAIAMPAALNPNGSSELTFMVDPGDGTYRTLVDDSGTALTLTNITQGEVVQIQEEKPPIVGANLKLKLSADESDGDITFIVMMRPLKD